MSEVPYYTQPMTGQFGDERPGQEKAQGALEALDVELEVLEKFIEHLTQRLDPVVNRYAGDSARLSEPVPEPASALRGRVMRVAHLRSRLERLAADLDL